MYKISTYESQYFEEMGKPLGVCVPEHMKNVQLGKTNTRLAEHAWGKQHRIQWDAVSIVLNLSMLCQTYLNLPYHVDKL